MSRIARKLTAVCAFICAAAFTFTAPQHAHAEAADGLTKIILIAGKPSHGYGAHEFNAGCLLMSRWLEQSVPNVKTEVYLNGQWPQDWSTFDDAAAVVIFCNGGGGHLVMPRLEPFDKVMKKGVGLVCLHYAVEVPKGDAGDYMLKWMGGYFEPHWSVNPHWKATYEKLPQHEITRGVGPFTADDEWYFHMRFVPKMDGVTPILSALPPAETMKRPDGAHSGNPAVREAIKNKEAQHTAWAYQRPAEYNNGRGFGFTGLHWHWNWANDDFRKLVLNAVVWAAKIEVPTEGVATPTPTQAELEANQDYPKPGNARPQVAVADAKPKDAVFASKVVSPSTKGHAVEIEADIKGAKQLYLVVTDGGDGFGCDWADWAEPRLIDSKGNEKKLTDLKWKSAESQWGQVRIGNNAGGGPLKIDGKPVAYGIGTHANSVIGYDLPADHDFVKFKALGGIDNGGTEQGCGSTVSFMVFTKAPGKAVVTASAAGAGGDQRQPENALAGLDVHEDLQAELFAAEPLLTNPSNIDIDHAGRVWVCEIVNYRGHRNKRPQGDRILILEDSDGDGKADSRKVFYQGEDINSPHGVCVLATPDFKGTRVIVSAGDKVMNFYDDDGDGQADRKDIMFTGIAGSQHDHGIHVFKFGPDGKLYFNFGNSGRHIKDKDGKTIVDMAGNEVVANRKPYQEGMVFRCNLDGSDFETLGWNFRNNWMVTPDSFGTLWQSDNDDDGNKGVRINYVMEYGNYGYKDEFTGKGWRDQRANIEEEIPLRHWHLNDPGVVPNLLQTGAGSPTGITVYEGDLLPEVFRGQMIHTDAGPNVVRAYPVEKDGAGYKAEMVNILRGERDKWFRPADVQVAPDGSLIVADWYDPGVGGHAAGDLERGRLFRVTPAGHKGYKVPEYDFSTPAGATLALLSPNYATRYVAYQALRKMENESEAVLKQVYQQGKHPRHRARALWVLSKHPFHGKHHVAAALEDKDADIRITAIRAARQIKLDMTAIADVMKSDPSPQVRREVAIVIRDVSHGDLSESQLAKLAGIWADLAAQHDGEDRWYLEALGIAAERHWDAFFSAWLKKVGGPEKAIASKAGRDIVWRARTKAALPLLAKILTDPQTPKQTRDRYVRALDFHPKSPEKDAALQAILGL